VADAVFVLEATPGPRRARRRDLKRRSREHTAVVLRREQPDLYAAISAALRDGTPAAEIARAVQVSRRTVAAVRRCEIGERDVAQVRALQATRAREVAELAAEELRRRLVDAPARVPARELVSALRVAGEFARADEGAVRAGGDRGLSDDDAREVLLLVRRGSRRVGADGFRGVGEGDPGPRAIEVEVGPARTTAADGGGDPAARAPRAAPSEGSEGGA
jgi:hypothetical protein